MASPVKGGPCTAPCCTGIEKGVEERRGLIIQNLRIAALYEIDRQEREAKRARIGDISPVEEIFVLPSQSESQEPLPELAPPLLLSPLRGADVIPFIENNLY